VSVKELSLFSRLWLLFITFARIAAFVLGGGLAMLPVIEETFVVRKKIISHEDLLDMVTVTQTVPGIIAANSAVFIGTRVAGFAGAVAALSGVMLPSFVIIVIIAWLFPELKAAGEIYMGIFAGVRAGVTGLISVTAYKMVKKNGAGYLEAAAGLLFFILALAGVHPGWLIISGMAAGLIYCMFRCKIFDKKSGTAQGGEK